MNPNLKPTASQFSAVKRWFFSFFGTNEVLFCAGFACLGYGLQGLWSLYGALAVCGSVLIVVAVMGIMVGRGKDK